ncbi:50S ribosomal protein L35ae, partial [Candidatus Woesearchaeota archaeon CG10_big_fil_rev_8_21_14_0_10_34_8]
TNQMIISPEGVSKREQAEKLVGKAVTFTTKGKKTISGKVASAHGNKGALRVIFEKGMPGQAISEKVDIQ